MPLSCQSFIKIIALSVILSSCDSDRSESEKTSVQTTPDEIINTPISEEIEGSDVSTLEVELKASTSNEQSSTDKTPSTDEDAPTAEEPSADEEPSTEEEPSTNKELSPSNQIPSTLDNESLDTGPLPTDDFEITQLSKPSEPYCLGPGSKNAELIHASCLSISNRLASVSNEGCIAANLMLSQCQSVEQFPILYSEFPPLNGNPAKGRVLVIGGTHGDELTSVSMVFRWIEKLNKFHTGLFHWHMVPVMNPDGVLKTGATRTNANGVDLNRNLPSNDWREKALQYWNDKTDKNARRYPGETPASEPETQWLIDEINSFKPDAIISVHAPYGLVDFDAPVLNTAPKSLGRLMLNILGTYPGSLGNYAGINHNIPVITLELPHSWVMPSEDETTKLWEDIVRWLRINVDNPTPNESQTD